jgi:hypothetical protein
MPRRGGQRGAPCRGSADRDVVVGGAVIRSRVKWAWHCTLDLDVLGDSHVNLTIKSGVIETVREFFNAILLLSLFLQNCSLFKVCTYAPDFSNQKLLLPPLETYVCYLSFRGFKIKQKPLENRRKMIVPSQNPIPARTRSRTFTSRTNPRQETPAASAARETDSRRRRQDSHR